MPYFVQQEQRRAGGENLNLFKIEENKLHYPSMNLGVRERTLTIQHLRKQPLWKSPEKTQTVINSIAQLIKVLLTQLTESCSSRNTFNWEPDCSSASSCSPQLCKQTRQAATTSVGTSDSTAPLGVTSCCNKSRGSKNPVVSLEKEIKSSKPKWVLLSKRTSFGECSCWLQTQDICWFANIWLLKIRLFLEIRIQVLASA